MRSVGTGLLCQGPPGASDLVGSLATGRSAGALFDLEHVTNSGIVHRYYLGPSQALWGQQNDDRIVKPIQGCSVKYLAERLRKLSR